MSKFLKDVIAEEFDTQVKQAYQTSSMLRPTVTYRHCNDGVYHFRRQGKGIATPHIPQGQIVPMDISHTKIACILEGWDAPEYTDIFDQSEVNFNEMKTLTYTIGSAIGRRQDQLIIDALENEPKANLAGDIAIDYAPTTELSPLVFSVAKLKKAKALLDNLGVPSGDRYIKCGGSAVEQLLSYNRSTGSIKYNQIRALVDGEIDYFMGFKFVIVPDTRAESTHHPTDEYAYCYHKSSIGLACSLEPKTEVTYDPRKTSWLSNGMINAGSTIIDPKGIVGLLYARNQNRVDTRT